MASHPPAAARTLKIQCVIEPLANETIASYEARMLQMGLKVQYELTPMESNGANVTAHANSSSKVQSAATNICILPNKPEDVLCIVCNRKLGDYGRHCPNATTHNLCRPCKRCGAMAHYKRFQDFLDGSWACDCWNQLEDVEKRDILSSRFVSELVTHSGIEDARQLCGWAVKWNGVLTVRTDRHRFTNLGNSTLTILQDIFNMLYDHGRLDDAMLERAMNSYKNSMGYLEGEFEPVFSQQDVQLKPAKKCQ